MKKQIKLLIENLFDDIYDDNGEIIVKKNHMITPKRAEAILKRKVIEENAKQWCKENGKEVVIIPRTEGISSTLLRNYSKSK